MRLTYRILPVFFTLLVACSPSATEESATQARVVTTPPAAADTSTALTAQTRAQVAPAQPDTAEVHDIAAFLGGLRPKQGSPLDSLASQPAWQAFATDANKSWQKYDLSHTVPMRKWAAAELDSARQASPVVFYPFSGPDFLNVFTLFPTANTYVLVGLEPVGSIPSASVLRSPDLFKTVKASLWSVLNFSFFRTNDMAVDLKSAHLDGTVPLMMLFAARTGNQLLAIRPVQLDNEGLLQPLDTTQRLNPKHVPGTEIKIRAADGTDKTVYYFSADISDGNLTAHPALLRHVATLGPLTTYVKSASYLMHKNYFSKVRNLILAQSQYVLQDDSGIAMKYFPKDWDFTFYGTYKRPINLFAKHYQPALTAAYADSVHRLKPLPFGTGYNWRQTDSNLLLAHRKQKPAS